MDLGVSPEAFYSWKRRYAGVGLNEQKPIHWRETQNPWIIWSMATGGGS